MIFRQVTHDDLGCASYLIGDDDAGVAAVVDPRLDVDEYLRLADYLGVRIAHVLETHTHADHVSGRARLVDALGATPHTSFRDGEEIVVGAVVIRAMATPGHRPEHCAFALVDTARGDEPWAVLTGDSLFVGDIARPDLAVEAVDGARAMFASVHDRLLRFGDDVEVWPAHLGGSLCGGPGMDLKPSSTIGYERRHNPLLATEDEETFVTELLDGIGPQPPHVQAVVARNAGDAAQPADGPDGTVIVDVRPDEEFDAGHLPGAVCNPATRAGFGTRLGWVADLRQPVVLVGRDEADARAALPLAAAVGFENVATSGLDAHDGELATIERVDVGDLRVDGVQLLDVRERAEWDAGHVEGSTFLPWHDIAEVPEGLDPERPIAVICASGQRAATGASLLARAGAAQVIHVVGGGVPTLLDG